MVSAGRLRRRSVFRSAVASAQSYLFQKKIHQVFIHFSRSIWTRIFQLFYFLIRNNMRYFKNDLFLDWACLLRHYKNNDVIQKHQWLDPIIPGKALLVGSLCFLLKLIQLNCRDQNILFGQARLLIVAQPIQLYQCVFMVI